MKNLSKRIAILLAILVFLGFIFQHFTLKTYASTVTFETQGHGVNTFSLETDIDKTVRAPYLEDSLYVFDGWYLEPECITSFNFKDTINSDMTLYASWIPFFTASSVYTVSFYTGRDDVVISSQSITSGGIADVPIIPEEYISQFDGWYADMSYNTEYNFSAPVFSNLTLCAKWTEPIKMSAEQEEKLDEEDIVEEDTFVLEDSKTIFDLDYWYNGIDADTYSRKIVDACSTIPSTGKGLCASWVAYVYQEAGLGYLNGDAVDFWSYYGVSNNVSDLKPGMIISVPHSPTSLDGWRYGHTGIVLNTTSGWMVADSTGTVNLTPLQEWIAQYDATNQVKWGWGHVNPSSRINWVSDIAPLVEFKAVQTPVAITSPVVVNPSIVSVVPVQEPTVSSEPETKIIPEIIETIINEEKPQVETPTTIKVELRAEPETMVEDESTSEQEDVVDTVESNDEHTNENEETEPTSFDAEIEFESSVIDNSDSIDTTDDIDITDEDIDTTETEIIAEEDIVSSDNLEEIVEIIPEFIVDAIVETEPEITNNEDLIETETSNENCISAQEDFMVVANSLPNEFEINDNNIDESIVEEIIEFTESVEEILIE